MPWKLVKKGEKTCVMKESTGEVVKCHMTHKEALDHMKALYANVQEVENLDASFPVPIESMDIVQEGDVKWLHFGGLCLKPTISRNKVKYTIDNVQELDNTHAKFFVTHTLSPENSVGHVSFTKEGDTLKYNAKVRNTMRHPDIVEAIKDKRVDVSIDARYKKIWREEESGEKVFRVDGLEPRGLCAVGVGGLSENSIEYAIAEEFGKLDAKIVDTIKQEEEVMQMEASEQLKQVLQEKEDLQRQLTEMKVKLQEEEKAKKKKVVEEIISYNKEFVATELESKTIQELEMILGYEKKLTDKKKKVSEGAAEVDTKLSEEDVYGDIIIEKEGDIVMGKKLYKQFNQEIRNKIPMGN